jgi:hypothetical protein
MFADHTVFQGPSPLAKRDIQTRFFADFADTAVWVRDLVHHPFRKVNLLAKLKNVVLV